MLGLKKDNEVEVDEREDDGNVDHPREGIMLLHSLCFINLIMFLIYLILKVNLFFQMYVG